MATPGLPVGSWLAFGDALDRWQQSWAESVTAAMRPLVEQMNRMHEQLDEVRPFTEEQLAAFGRAFAEDLARDEPAEAVIRIPGGAEITAVQSPPPAPRVETGSRFPAGAEIRRYYFNPPITEQRRPR